MSSKLQFILLYTIIASFIYSQFPETLNQNESYDLDFSIEESGEYLLYITASSNTSWAENNNESSILTLYIDGTHNQDVILYNGTKSHVYKQAIGFLESGDYILQSLFDYNKSSQNANIINIENLEFKHSNLINSDQNIIRYSPIIYGRNIFSEDESNHTDIPLIMYHKTDSYTDLELGNLHSITYNIIFSNEDSRIGIGLSDMMLSWGRTTDIEWVYQVTLNDNEEIVSEVFQGASHTTTDFNGEKLNTHPYLINATANCNFADTGTSDYKLFLSPFNETDNNHTSEYIMDQNPWSYKIMGEELINENKYEDSQDVNHWELSDIRNYLYIEYNGQQTGAINKSNISAIFYNDCYHYSNDHNDADINFNFGNGINRTAIELPEGFNPSDLQYLHISTSSDAPYTLTISDIIQVFYLSTDYELINIDLQSVEFPIELNETSSSVNLVINESTLSYDCNEELNGEAYCDECYICSGGQTGNMPNEDMDSCGVCFGNNQDIDCDGICFGDSYYDGCDICDNDPSNDGNTCSGCIDINANNYDSEAYIFDNSCIYSDKRFLVPAEYIKIQDAVFFTSPGDTVLVEPGTYYEEIDFLEKGISLISTSGPEQTIIIANTNDNGNGGVYEPDRSVITIRDVISQTATLDGFTLQEGHGKGVNFEYFVSVASDPSMFNDMMNNLIKSGGIAVINSSITLSNLIVKDNTAQNFGAGIGLVNSNSTLENITIENNHILDGDALGGGGIAINGGTTVIDNCIIHGNTVGTNMYQLNGGGGILCGFNFSDTPLELTTTNTIIYNNIANIGAGIGALSGNIELDRVLIYGNTGDYGSAVCLGEPLGLVVDNINMIITNSTIANNSGTLSFGLIDNSSVIIANSILLNNGSYEFTNLPNNSTLDVNAFHSDINLSDNIETTNSISTDPMFIDYPNNNLNLTSNSPCVNTGTNLLIIDGNTIIDMSTSEYHGIMPDMGYFELTAIGDINQDDSINIFDIILLVEIIIYNEEYIASGDIDQDGTNSVVDIISLINIILNLK